MLKNPYVELDTGKKESMSFESAKLLKSISDDDFKWLKASTRGNENKAKELVMTLTANHLRSLINAQKQLAGYVDSVKGGSTSTQNSGYTDNWEISSYKGKDNNTTYLSDVAENVVDGISDFVSDSYNTVTGWLSDNILNPVKKFVDENVSQLDVNTETYQVVKDVYKDYRKSGIDFSNLGAEDYAAEYGIPEFVNMIQNSTMLDADMYPNNVFWTEKEASEDFHNEANPITIADNREVGTIIVLVPVTFVDQNGDEFVVKMYTRDDAYEGMEGNVIAGTATRIAAYTMDPLNPIRVSVDHTHPESGWDNKFSRGIIGDELVARWPTVDNMLVGDVETGSLLRFDESMPNTLFTKQKNINYYEDYEDEILPDGTLTQIPKP